MDETMLPLLMAAAQGGGPQLQPSYFMGQVQAARPLFMGGGVPTAPPALNLTGLPGMGGPQGMLLQMLMKPMVDSVFGPGMIPAQFSPVHNVYDQQRRLADVMAMQQAMRTAGPQDTQTYASLLRGMARTAGHRINDDRERAVQAMAADFQGVAQMVGPAMPELFDRLHGSRGSAAIMAQQLFMGGRYAIDPVTGLSRWSGETAGAVAGKVHEMLYGPGADLAETRGLGAGRMGSLYDELQRRGVGPRALTREQQREMMVRERVAGGASLEAAVGDVGSLGGAQFESKVRDLESGRIAAKLKSMAGAVAAMKDIFGELGQPDAPMSQLIEGLQMMTQGGLSHMTPQKMEQVVRDTANLARRTGVGVDNAMQLLAVTSQQADRLGIARPLAVSATDQAISFGHAYGITTGDTPAWGRRDKTAMTMIDRQLSLNAAGSTTANMLATTLRMEAANGPFAAGTEAAAMAAAVRAGRTEYTFGGRTKSVYSSERETSRILAEGLVAGGADAATAARTVQMMRSQSAYNQKTIDEYGLGGVARELQGRVDIVPRVSQLYERAFRAAGYDRDAAGNARLVARTLLTMDPAKVQDADAVMAAAGVNLTGAARDKFKRALGLGWGAGEQWIAKDPRVKEYRSFDAAITAQNATTLREARFQREEAQVESRLQTAMAGLGRGSAVERTVDALIDAKPGTSAKEIMSKVLGYIPSDDVVKALEPEMAELAKEARAYGAAATAPADRRKGIRDAALARIGKFTASLNKRSKELGLYTDDPGRRPDYTALKKRLREGEGDFVGAAESAAEEMLGDPKAMAAYGQGGADAMARVMENNRKIRDLAAKTTGNDVEKLIHAHTPAGHEARLLRDQNAEIFGIVEGKGGVDKWAAARAEIMGRPDGPDKSAALVALDKSKLAEEDKVRKLTATRGMTDAQVVKRLGEAVGFGSGDRVAYAKAVQRATGPLTGARGKDVRLATLAAEEFAAAAKDKGLSFDAYVKSLSPEQKSRLGAFADLTPSAAPDALANIVQKFSDFAPRASQVASPAAGAAASGFSGQVLKVIMDGTLTVPGLGDGKVEAKGRGGIGN